MGDCNRVQDSQYTTVAGIPVAALGLAMYATLLALAIVRRAGGRRRTRRLFRTWTFAIALAGTLYSAYLTYLEFFVIDAICAWCVASAVVLALLALLAWPDVRGSRDSRGTGGDAAR